ncbi:hypothetical protein SAMD00024442_21_60 [Candidatus Symbiothrix dinenymphae]|nr:hypothetical protein SAMD00024442_21_60 [Candidatus Symbiothrix dinenymphae]
MKKEINSNLTSFESHLESQYGARGTAPREQYEEEFETFRVGVMLQELRRNKGLTQEKLAQKCGTANFALPFKKKMLTLAAIFIKPHFSNLPVTK